MLTFHYNHGQGQYEVRRTIAAGDQLWLNLGDIIHGSIPDTKGRTFPLDLTWGTYEIREPGRNADPSLFEGKIIVDTTYGHFAYGCATCCGDGFPGIVADPENLPFQAQDTLAVIATNACTGYDDNLTENFSGWDTGNSSIATMNSTHITAVGLMNTQPRSPSEDQVLTFQTLDNSAIRFAPDDPSGLPTRFFVEQKASPKVSFQSISELIGRQEVGPRWK